MFMEQLIDFRDYPNKLQGNVYLILISISYKMNFAMKNCSNIIFYCVLLPFTLNSGFALSSNDICLNTQLAVNVNIRVFDNE